ncbi:MAG TPA: hypothetical protein VGH74_06010, partial [Planctomycetaceae bacterium]
EFCFLHLPLAIEPVTEVVTISHRPTTASHAKENPISPASCPLEYLPSNDDLFQLPEPPRETPDVLTGY